jgi:hypothetical protein
MLFERCKQRLQARFGHRDQHSTRGLGVGEHQSLGLAELPPIDMRIVEAPIRLRAARDASLRRELACDRQIRDRARVQIGLHAAALQHPVQVTEQAVSGHIGRRIRACFVHRQSRPTVQRRHDRDDVFFAPLGQEIALERGREDAGAERLRQHQDIPGPRPRIRDDAVAVHAAGRHQTVLRFWVVDRVATQDVDAGFARLVGATAQDVAQNAHRQLLGWERDDVEREQRFGAHRVQIGQCVRRRHLAERIRVVDQWREEVERLHQGGVALQREYRSVIGRRDADQDARVADFRKLSQDLRQVFRVQLARSPSSVTQSGESDRFQEFDLQRRVCTRRDPS